MEILLTEASSGDADDTAIRLANAGHTVTRCNLAGTDRCAPLVTMSGCPLRERAIQVVVDVRHEEVGFGPHELGAMCAVQAGVPLVVCGPTPDEAGPWRDADVRCTEDALLDVLDLADPVAGAATRHRVWQAVVSAMRTLGREDRVEVAVRSAPGAVLLDVTIDEPVPDMLGTLLPTVVRGALAGVTLHWAGAQIAVSARSAAVEAGDPAERGEAVVGAGPVPA